jgi:hypothetical protein
MREGEAGPGGVTLQATPDAQRIDRIADALWTDAPGRDVYAILDCARDARIHPWINRRALDYTSLYRGPVAPVLDRCAPYLVHLYRRESWTRELLSMSWGRSWGIFVRTTEPMETLRVHFRRFLRVRDERGRRLVFRYYDPRVLRLYLPTCTENELRTVFGTVGQLCAERADAAAVVSYHNDGGVLGIDERTV